MCKMFATNAAPGALYAPKALLESTAVSPVWTRVEQITQRCNSLLWQNSAQKKRKSFVFILWDKVLSSELTYLGTNEARQQLLVRNWELQKKKKEIYLYFFDFSLPSPFRLLSLFTTHLTFPLTLTFFPPSRLSHPSLSALRFRGVLWP
jgi:hypothetical protein